MSENDGVRYINIVKVDIIILLPIPHIMADAMATGTIPKLFHMNWLYKMLFSPILHPFALEI